MSTAWGSTSKTRSEGGGLRGSSGRPKASSEEILVPTDSPNLVVAVNTCKDSWNRLRLYGAKVPTEAIYGDFIPHRNKSKLSTFRKFIKFYPQGGHDGDQPHHVVYFGRCCHSRLVAQNDWRHWNCFGEAVHNSFGADDLLRHSDRTVPWAPIGPKKRCRTVFPRCKKKSECW